ncbi:MAG: cache domain-containing protein [Deltaproteobacteria bacterium]|uniref:cache domain-containing protein n=1 Tax=Desulfobacula sp. TaxID=2593537 RepID=UPI0019C0511C|nr:cache domain-containing protein [Candidatus Desulfobacula maris]MBL6995494.1 cache domain-containing protein [Desulfobacula sp.]
MFKTIRSKILILIIGLMAVTSMTFIFITTKNYQTEISEQHYKLAKETLTSTIRIIDTAYNDLLSYDINTIKTQRSIMENAGTSIVSMVDTFYYLQETGMLTEQLAKDLCLNRIQEYRYETDKSFFVSDLNLTGLSHPNKEMVGKKWSGFEDLKKRDVLSLIREAKEKIFTVFMWPRLKDMKQVKQIGYFLYYPQWEWIIGTAYEMDNIKKISLAKEEHTLSYINEITGQASLNEIGGILIFDSNGKVIIHTSHLKNIDLNPAGITLDKSIQDHLKKASEYPDKPVEYRSINRSRKEMIKIAYVDYYKYMDWYVAVFVDKNESFRAGSAIAVRQFMIFVLVFLFGIVLAFFISKKITHPLALLTKYTRDLPECDFTLKDNPLLGSILSSNHSDEIKQLAESFAYMETRLGENLNELRKKTQELKRLNEHLIYAEEKERKVFAADLHDSVAQTLALSISKIKNIQEPGEPVNLEIIAQIQGHLEQAVKEIRSLIYQLSPPVLDDFEIDIALGFLIEESNEKYGADIKYINAIDNPVHLKKSNKIALYRSVNELVINIIKHSGSKDAEIEISQKENWILLRIEDKGVGFDLNKVTNKDFSGFGIYSISERIKNLSGNFELFSKPGKGTKILLSIPLLSENEL